MRERVDKAALPAKLAFENDIVDIYELRNPAPYFSAAGCELGYSSQDRVTASCAAPSVMRRSELAMAGWAVTVNGTSSVVGVLDDRYQIVNLPQGKSTVSFDFSPPHARLGWLASAAALIFLAAGSWRAKRAVNVSRQLTESVTA